MLGVPFSEVAWISARQCLSSVSSLKIRPTSCCSAPVMAAAAAAVAVAVAAVAAAVALEFEEEEMEAFRPAAPFAAVPVAAVAVAALLLRGSLPRRGW